ncbi:MAG: DUF1501 domain-containing protein [Planctomycetia bacterium]|nr:DUF1501 domain-containing protein [Planctomycetia bacterium]
MLQIGGLGLMGLSLPRLLAAETAAQAEGLKPRADSCVLIFLNGGPSHLDMWDMKPDAPDGIRGEFKPISTSVSGIQFGEHLPKLAQHAHRSTIVRSMHHSVNNAHAAAVYTSLTGHDRGDNTPAIGGGSGEYPSTGSVLGKLRPPERTVVPHVCLPFITKEGAGGPPQSGFFGGMLGRAYDPLFVLKDPNSKDFAVPELTLLADVSVERMAARQALFQAIDERFERGPGRSAYDGMDGFRRRALKLLTSEGTQRALRIGDEQDATRDSYGRNIYGQSVLLARRLIEAGTRMVTISWAPDANATWDTHGSNFKKLKNTLLPQFDAAASSLVSDLADRGLLDRTLVAVMGDFGRTPKINASDGGRDHWNYCYSLMLIGGGVKGGFIYGASDKIGAFPARDALVPGDIISTIYHLLGVPNDYELRDQLGRPHRLVPAGNVVPSLIA